MRLLPVEGLNFSKEAPFPPPMPTAEINTSSWGIGEEADVYGAGVLKVETWQREKTDVGCVVLG
jgi:hypothetical protein